MELTFQVAMRTTATYPPTLTAMAPGQDLVDRRRTLLTRVLTGYLAVVTVAPIATTPYRSDDLINRRTPEAFAASGQSLVEFIVAWVGPWVRDQGRLFPGSALWTFAVFTAFQDRVSYKVFLAGLVLLMVALVAATAATLTRPALLPVAVAGCVATLHLRDYFDGLDTFSGVMPFTICGTLVALLLLLRRRGWASAVVAAVVWTDVLLTYEVAIVLTPTLGVLVWWVTRRWVRALPLLVPMAAVSAVVLVLRSRVTTYVGEAYRINLEPDLVLTTYVKQAAGALPWSTQWYPGTTATMAFDPALLVLAALVVAAPVAVLLTVVASRPLDLPRGATAQLAMLGASMWLLPPVLVAVSLGWQTDLPPGQAYVSVVWGYVGVALLATAGWAALADGARRGWQRLALPIATAVMAVAAAGSVVQSVSVAALLAANPH
jgi:hypothetical protein